MNNRNTMSQSRGVDETWSVVIGYMEWGDAIRAGRYEIGATRENDISWA